MLNGSTKVFCIEVFNGSTKIFHDDQLMYIYEGMVVILHGVVGTGLGDKK